MGYSRFGGASKYALGALGALYSGYRGSGRAGKKSAKASKRSQRWRRMSKAGRRKKKRKRRGGYQSIYHGDSRVFIPSGVRKTRQTKLMKQISLKLKAEFNQVGRFTSPQSQQGMTWIVHYPPSHLTELVNRTTGAVATSACYLESMQSYLTLANMDANDATIWIYSLVLRNDAGALGINPVDDWGQGMLDEGGVANDRTVPYTTPYCSKKFTERWKVHKVQKFVLSSGAQHIHHIKMRPMHKINKERFTNTGAVGTGGATQGVKYLTCATMIVSLGALINDEVTKALVTYGQTAIDYTANWKYTAHGVADDQTVFYKNVSYPTVTTAKLINEKTGAVIVDAFA